MDRTPDDPKDIDLNDPQINALTTPDLDGDDIQEVEDANVGGETPSEPSAHDFEGTGRDPAEGGDVPEARPA